VSDSIRDPDIRQLTVTVTVECPCCSELIDIDILGRATINYNRVWLAVDPDRQGQSS
jgi:hypothetical protein